MQEEMEGVIYAFTKEEGIIFELVTNEGDNVYWANLNGGIPLSPEDMIQILQGKDAGKVVNDIWKQMHHRV
jgi:hypothetical protein